VTGNTGTQVKGAAQQIKGKVETAVGKLKDAVSDAKDDAVASHQTHEETKREQREVVLAENHNLL
jgi:hypothetical protein